MAYGNGEEVYGLRQPWKLTRINRSLHTHRFPTRLATGQTVDGALVYEGHTSIANLLKHDETAAQLELRAIVTGLMYENSKHVGKAQAQSAKYAFAIAFKRLLERFPNVRVHMYTTLVPGSAACNEIETLVRTRTYDELQLQLDSHL